MTHYRTAIAVLAVAAILLPAGCTPTTSTSSPVPSSPVSSVTPTPTPTPTPTYGPNQQAVIEVVTKYYAWINRQKKEPGPINGVALQALAEGPPNAAAVYSVRQGYDKGQRQVGDLILASIVPAAESTTEIKVAVCTDSSQITRLQQETPVPAPTNVPTRQAYLYTAQNKGGSWILVDSSGGMSSC